MYGSAKHQSSNSNGGALMEDPRQLQTLKIPEATAFSFPPHRRQPIRSQTYFNLIKLLYHCHTHSSLLNGLSNGVALGRGGAENIHINHCELKSAELLVPNDIVVQGTGISESIANVGFQDRDFDDERTTVSELGCAKVVTDGEEVVTRADSTSVRDCLVGGNLNVDCSVQFVKEQENLDSVHVGSMGELTVDNEFSIDDFSEVLDSCFGGDMVCESSKSGNNSKENNSALEVNTSKEFEHRVQLKEMELEKLVSTSGMDEEIEEGEIYVDTVVCDMSIDPLSNNAAPLGMISIHTSEDNGYKEEFTCKSEDRRLCSHDTCVDKENDGVKVNLRASSRPAQDIQSQSFVGDGYMETQGIDAIPTFLETLPLTGLIPQKHIHDNPISAITKKEGDGRNKRKNGSSAKEARTEKKKRKRAEKNRKLGIKRLKLQTLSKPKKIMYCRHYLQGKCHEGEKCKFSHDTTPLTKSKPCGHFARKSCMKGDDCPYDHQLSKYPCNNYTSTGFCSRGADCLFSHQIPENQILSTTPNVLKSELKSEQRIRPDKAGSFTASKVSKPVVKLLPQLNNSNSSNSSDILTSCQKADAKFSSPRKSGNSIAKYVAKPFSRTVAHAPKGVFFLADTSLGQNSKLKLDESVKKSGDAVIVVHGANPKVPSSTNKLNETSEELTSRKPRGVNFLTFAQSSVDGSTFKTFSNLFSDKYKEAGKLVMADGKQNRPLPKNGEFFKSHGQTSRNATDLLCNLNGEASRTPATIPLHINSVLRDKSELDDSASRKPADGKYGFFLSSTEEKSTIPSKFPVKMHLLPLGGSCDQSTSAGYHQTVSSPFKTSLLSNTPSLVQKAFQSTLAFAARFDPEIKSGQPLR